MPINHFDANTQTNLAIHDPILEVHDLCYTYPDGQQAIRDIQFRLSPGDKLALVGHNGSGKSTLLLHLNGILSGSGSISVCGVKIEKQNLAMIRTLIGLVFQNPDDQLFSPTVFEDVAFGPLYQGVTEEEILARVEIALDQVGMTGYAQRSSYHLSIGEKKRIAIATVLSMEAKILVFDEPTAGLDPRARRQLIDLITALPQTMLIATHDLRMAQECCNRVLVLDHGEIVADQKEMGILEEKAFLISHGLDLP